MKKVILRGFDYKVTDLFDRMRLCQPIISPETGILEESRLFLIKSISTWRYFNQNVTTDLAWGNFYEFSSFGTFLAHPKMIKRKRGILVIGKRYYLALKELESLTNKLDSLKINLFEDENFVYAILTLKKYRKFTEYVENFATDLFDNHVVKNYPKRREQALYLLRGNSMASPEKLILREIVKAKIDEDKEKYDKLLVRTAFDFPALNYLLNNK